MKSNYYRVMEKRVFFMSHESILLISNKFFDLYRKLKAIPSEHSEIITGRTTDYDKPINLSIEQVRNIIKTAAPSITNKEKSMINFYEKPS